MEGIKRSYGWKDVFGWAVLWVALGSGNSAFAAFTDDIAAGVDNTSFTYLPYEDGARCDPRRALSSWQAQQRCSPTYEISS